jgi:RNA polymerase sigma-70 factor, ECF subfamily
MTPEDTFEASRTVLFALAYRMLGSVMDAEDCLQDAFLHWQRMWQHQQADMVRSPRSYLCTIVTRLALDHLRAARVQREHYVGVWLPEPLVTSEAQDDPAEIAVLDESLSLAFLLLLERLAPVERAVFLLHHAFGFPYQEIAPIIHKSEENCRQIGRRAQQHLDAGRARFDADVQHQARLTQLFVQACAMGDVQGLVDLLSEDIVLHSDGGGKVRAALNPIVGRDHVARFLWGIFKKAPKEVDMTYLRMNGRLGIVLYHQGMPLTVVMVAGVQEHVTEIDLVLNPDKLRRIPNMPPQTG